MKDAFKIPWVDAYDMEYVKKGTFRVGVIYVMRQFYYDIFVSFQ